MEEPKKRGRFIDKLILGAIIGGAIGSVLGLTLAPKKGKETRDLLKEKGKEVYRKGKDIHGQFMEEYGEDIEKITETAKTTSKNFFGKIGKKVTDIFEKRKEVLHRTEDKKNEWEIPDESDM